jgi:hypothetical protein
MFNFTPEQVVILVTQFVTFSGIVATFLMSRANNKGINSAKQQLQETTAKVDNVAGTAETIAKSVNGHLDRLSNVALATQNALLEKVVK